MTQSCLFSVLNDLYRISWATVFIAFAIWGSKMSVNEYQFRINRPILYGFLLSYNRMSQSLKQYYDLLNRREVFPYIEIIILSACPFVMQARCARQTVFLAA
jgi:hypothetical protein